MKSTAMINLRASTHYMTKQAKTSGTDGLEPRWTTCATPHFCVGHMLTVMDTEDVMLAPLTEDVMLAPLVKGIHLG